MTINNGGRKIEFKVEEGKILLVIEHLIWDEWMEQMRVDVTEEIKVALEDLEDLEEDVEVEEIEVDKPKTRKSTKTKG